MPRPYKRRPPMVVTLTATTAFSKRYRIENLKRHNIFLTVFATIYDQSVNLPTLVEYVGRRQIMQERFQAAVRPIIEKAIKDAS